ncbi:isoprenylcysteine carboxylmethyltransferase family protein [Chryseolinea sp. T2]|uniref:methyltransferase family protein n=1 Tax=Chryseolinea sp. T2 TaxID=3129255 RepID=UPI00307823DD
MFANTVIGICWTAVVVIWLITGATSSATTRKTAGKAGRWFRFFLAIVFPLCFLVDDLRILSTVYVFPNDTYLQWISVSLCISGISFAIWARLHLGNSWAMPMTQTENTELVTSGPYHLVRHPIYAGLSLAMIGSMLAASALWSLWYITWTLYFLYSAFMEERALKARYPIDYPIYKSKSKMFIPFVL